MEQQTDFHQIFSRMTDWMDGSGPLSDIIISSRIRLARNMAGFVFYSQASEQQKRDLLNFVREKIMQTELGEQLWFLEMEDLSSLDRRILTERHLISRRLAESEGSGAVAFSHNEDLALMINEEDHLRIQVLANGLQLKETYNQINRIDQMLEEKMAFAFSSRYGYLTACPTNVGTGIRVSVMLHLPGLKMTGQIEKAFRAAKDLHLAIRGLYGEGSEPIGNLYQLSNQITLGKSEQQIIEDLITLAVEPIVEYERRAREKLLQDRLDMLEDKIFRALGILRYARLINSEETAFMLSLLRLGIQLKLIKDVDIKTANKLFLLTQPGHMLFLAGREMAPAERDEFRARFIRQHLN